MELRRKIKGIMDDIKYYLHGGRERAIEQARLAKYSDIIISEIREDNRKLSGTTMMIKTPRKSDELSTNRATHQARVAGIAGIVATKLRLNARIVVDSAENHDLGHTPYGHSGEWWESEIFKDIGMGYRCHNAIGARRLVYSTDLYDRIINKIKAFNPKISESELKKIRSSLWLVIDPILCHNGESSKRKLMVEPNLDKTEEDFERELRQCYITEGYDRTLVPGTAEGSLLRIVDVISYVGQDMIDGLREGIITDLDDEYRLILRGFGIRSEEIDLAIAKKSYDGLARKIETAATQNLIANSRKNRIQMSDRMLNLVTKLKDKNNRAIVDKVVRPTENEVYPIAIRNLLYRFSRIFLEEKLGTEMNTLGNNLDKIKELREKYRGTPYENFITYLCNVTPSDYEFTVSTTVEATGQALLDELNGVLAGKVETDARYPLRTNRMQEMARDIGDVKDMTEDEKREYVDQYIGRSDNGQNRNFIPMPARIGIALGANYIETLNDKEFVELLENTGMLTPEQSADIRIKYNQLTPEELEMDTRQAGWIAIGKKQEEEERGQ